MTTLANRYRIIELLGQGAMGAVYRVADTLNGDRELALKLIHTTGVITPEAQLRFKEEFRAMVRLRHPNAIEVFDYGQIDEQNRFITMQIVDGPELTALIPPNGAPLNTVYRLASQLLQVLAFIHGRHFLHRDIKSQNIRVTGGEGGTLKLMDFGMMIQLGATVESGMSGTPGYMAPEVIQGGALTAATDLYAVGCLLFEMVTGQLPFKGSLTDIIRGHLTSQAPALRSVRPDVPERLESIVAKLLEKDPRVRYMDAHAVVEDLAALSGIAITRSSDEQRDSYLTSSHLVGRDRELQHLMEAMDATRSGRGLPVFIGAPAGVGKSRLLQEIALNAKLEDWPVVSTRGVESGMGPFEALAGALRPLLSRTDDESLQRHGPMLCRIFPELAERGLARASTAELGQDKLLLHDTLAAWLRELAGQSPMLWVFDDLQWSDPYSLEAYNTILRTLAGQVPILFLGGLRSDETASGSPVWYTVEEGITALIKLTPFDPEQVRALVSEMLPGVSLPDPILKDLYNATAGNAFFVTEALRDLMERRLLGRVSGTWTFHETAGLEILPSVEATIARRLENLPPGARELARIAAVLGRTPDRFTLLVVSELDEETFLDRLEILVEHQFILREGKGLTFPHDRVRTTLEESLPINTRQELHRRCGELLEAMEGSSTEALAYHFSRSADIAKAWRYLRQAGDQADLAGAEAVALQYWLAAETALTSLELADKVERARSLWWDIGFAAFVMYPRIAAEALGKLCESLDSDPNASPEMLHQAFTMRAVAQGFSGQPKEGLITVQRALSLVDTEGSPSHGATLIARTAPLMAAGKIDESVALSRQALSYLQGDLSGETPGTKAAKLGAIAGQNAIGYQGLKPDAAIRAAALVEAEAQGDPEPFTVFQFFGLWYAWTGRAADAQNYIEFTSQKCRRIGAPPYIWVLYLRPYLLWQRGEFAEAMSMVQQADRHPHLAQSDLPHQLLRILEGHLHLELGDVGSARKNFSSAESRGRSSGMSLVLLRALIGKAQLAGVEEQWDVAKKILDEVRLIAGNGPTRNPLLHAMANRITGEQALARGRWLEARPSLIAALSSFTSPALDNLIEAAHTHRALGQLAAGDRRPDEAMKSFGRAGAIYHQLRNPYFLHAVTQQVGQLQPAEAQRMTHSEPTPDAAANRSVESQYRSLQRLLGGPRPRGPGGLRPPN